MSRLTPPLFAACTALALTALSVAGCSSGAVDNPAGTANSQAGTAAPGGSGRVSGPVTIAMINKQGTQQYFVDEANGAKEAAKALKDVTINVTDAQLDSNAAINAINTVIAQKVNGIIITTPDSKIGPAIIKLAQQANIPLIATNDEIKDSSGKAAPYVGFSGTEMGEAVGEKAGQLFKASGWTSATTGIINVTKPDLPTCAERAGGSLAAFKTVAGSNMPKVINVYTDAGTPQALDRTGAVITGNPGIKNWVVWGCNDESETGAVTALQNAGFGADNVIGVGLGAYLTCKDWKAGQKTGNKAALSLKGADVGKAAVNLMIDFLRTGKPIPAISKVPTKIVDASNWQQSGVVCT